MDRKLFDAAAVEALAGRMRGALLAPGDAGYDEARRLYNAMIDRHPALIARCEGVADVIRAVNFARESGLVLSVRGGGHNVAGNAVCDGGLMIDLTPMKGVRIDPVARTARVEPGVLWREFDHEAQAFGLATTGGVITTTGVAGLTLGGGIGWLMGSHGLACDNLISVDMVTAAGRLVHASEAENAELFWGLRGGGGNFGVVTSFEFRLHPVGEILGGLILHPLDKAAELLRFYDKFADGAPDALGSMALFVTSPEGERVVAIAVGYNGPVAEGEKVLKPLRAFGTPLADLVAPMPYSALQSMFDAGFPSGQQNYWKANFLRGIDDDLVEMMVAHLRRCPSPGSAVALERFGGAVTRVDNEATAFNHRDARYNMLIVGIWPDPAEADPNVAWVRGLWDAVQPWSTGGVYVNYLGDVTDEGADRVTAAYGAGKFARLVALKDRYDPDNLFRLNQNIPPSGR